MDNKEQFRRNVAGGTTRALLALLKKIDRGGFGGSFEARMEAADIVMAELERRETAAGLGDWDLMHGGAK